CFGNACFTKTNAAGSAVGILNNTSGATLTRTTGAITGTIVAAVSGRNSTAHGIYNIAAGHQSVSLGNTNFSAGYSSVPVGLLNNTSGASLNSSTGAITGTITAGTVGISSVAIGLFNAATSTVAIAMGYGCSATNTGGIAIGYACTASGTQSLAIGRS